eukprot:1351270-Prymnesium_polylepis.1
MPRQQYCRPSTVSEAHALGNSSSTVVDGPRSTLIISHDTAERLGRGTASLACEPPLELPNTNGAVYAPYCTVMLLWASLLAKFNNRRARRSKVRATEPGRLPVHTQPPLTASEAFDAAMRTLHNRRPLIAKCARYGALQLLLLALTPCASGLPQELHAVNLRSPVVDVSSLSREDCVDALDSKMSEAAARHGLKIESCAAVAEMGLCRLATD